MKPLYRVMLFCALPLAACDAKKDEGSKHNNGGGGDGDGGYSVGRLILQSDADAATSLTATTPVDCVVPADTYRGEGVCLTPLNVSGFAMKADIHQKFTGAPVRLLSEDENTQGKGEIMPGAIFDLSKPGDGLVANNTLFEAYEEKPTYYAASIDMAYTRYKFELKSKFVTMIIPSYGQPFAQSAAVDSCEGITDEIRSQERYAAVDLLEGMEFERGDYLFCVKDTSEEECAAADFQWFDTTSNTLVAQRPTTPKRSFYLQNRPIDCQNDGNDRINFNFDPLMILADIPDDKVFQLYGDYSHGPLSHRSGLVSFFDEGSHGSESEDGDGEDENSPYMIYTYKPANGTETEGSTIKTTLTFQTEEMLFFDGIRSGDVASKTLEQMIAALAPRDTWAMDQHEEAGIDGFSVWNLATREVDVAVELTGGTEPPERLDPSTNPRE